GAFEVDPGYGSVRRYGRLDCPVIEGVRPLSVPALAAPHENPAGIGRQTIQPRTESRVAFEAAQLSVRLQEDLLEQVFALVRRTGHAAGQGVHARGMPAIQPLERLRVARLAARDELRVTHRQFFRR